MIKKISILLILVLGLSLIGCQTVKQEGITVNEISFERIKFEDLNEKEQGIIKGAKTEKGYKLIESSKKGYYYLAVFSGEKPTAGYSTKIIKVIDNEGITDVIAEETFPNKDAFVAQVLTYPFDIIELTGITDNIKIEFTTKEGEIGKPSSPSDNPNDPVSNDNSNSSTFLETQIVEAEYVGQIDNNSIEVKIEDGAVALRLTEMSKEQLAELKPQKGEIVRLETFRNENDQETVYSMEKVD